MISKDMLDDIALELSTYTTAEIRIKQTTKPGVYTLIFNHITPEFRDAYVIKDLIYLLDKWNIRKKYDRIEIFTEEELRYLDICFSLKEDPGLRPLSY